MTNGATDPDFLPQLPPDTLHIIVSRISLPDNTYATKISLSRKTRKYYAIGLLQEAILELLKSKSEVIGLPTMMEDFRKQDNNKGKREDDR